MLEFEAMSYDGKTFYRCKGKKRNTTYTISRNKSYRGERYKVVAGFTMLHTNCTLKKAIELANEYENNLKEPKSFKPFFHWD